MPIDVAAIRGLLFDKDGTLFSFQETWGGWTVDLLEGLVDGVPARVEALAESLRVDLERRVFLRDSPMIAGTEGAAVALMLPHLPEFTAQSLTAHMREALTRLAPVEAVPLAPFVDSLRRAGYRLGVATNDSETAALEQLERIGLGARFDPVIGYDSGHGAKPDPGPCRAFAERHGLRGDQVMMIGDSTADLLAGRAAGMVCVAVLTGPARAEDLAPLADAVLPDIGHVPELLGLT